MRSTLWTSSIPLVKPSKISGSVKIIESFTSSLPKPWVCNRCYHDSRRYQALRRHVQPPMRRRQSLTDYHASTNTTYRLNCSPKKFLSSNSQDSPSSSPDDLPSQKEGRRSNLNKRFSHVMDHMQSNIFIAGQRLNDLTGYSGIEALKKDIEQQGTALVCIQLYKTETFARAPGQVHPRIPPRSA